MTFQEYLAEHVVLGRATNLSKAAEQALIEGLDSPSLRILAGMDDTYNSFEIKSMLDRALLELNIELPDLKTAFNIFTSYYLRQVLSGELDPIETAKLFAVEILPKTKYYDQGFREKVGAISGVLNQLYGLYYEYEDVAYYEGDLDANIEKIKAAIISEAKEYLSASQSN